MATSNFVEIAAVFNDIECVARCLEGLSELTDKVGKITYVALPQGPKVRHAMPRDQRSVLRLTQP